MTYTELQGFIDYVWENYSVDLTKKSLEEAASDYLNDLHTEKCEERRFRDKPSEHFENEENDMNL